MSTSLYDEFCECAFAGTSMALTFNSSSCTDCVSNNTWTGNFELRIAKYPSSTATIITTAVAVNNEVIFTLTPAQTTGLTGRYDYQVMSVDNLGNVIVVDCGCILFKAVFV